MIDIESNAAQSSSLKVEVLGVRQVSPFWSHNPSNATGVKNQAEILPILTPIKFTGGVGEMYEWIFQAQPRTKPLINCSVSPLCVLGQSRSYILK